MIKLPLVTPETLDAVRDEVKQSLKMVDIDKKAYVDPKEEIKQQPIAISSGTHLFGGTSYPTPLGSYGDYSCIVGSSKSKKTFLKSAIVAGYIGGQASYYFDNLKGHDTKGKYVIDVDTEQSRFHAQRAFRRIEQMCGRHYPMYRGYALRQFSSEQRMLWLEWLFEKSPYKDNLGLVCIDGLVDLVTNFNDLDQCNKLQDNLLKWTAESGCHIIGVLHRNFNSDKPVGHIGSAVLKKAETVLYTENTDQGTLVKCEYSRNIPFSNFTFHVDDKWLPRKNDGIL